MRQVWHGRVAPPDPPAAASDDAECGPKLPSHQVELLVLFWTFVACNFGLQPWVHAGSRCVHHGIMIALPVMHGQPPASMATSTITVSNSLSSEHVHVSMFTLTDDCAGRPCRHDYG